MAVALGAADVALGTDTAGSGRVPAAFQGMVGIKPTVGLVPTRGVVPACRTLDCVTVMARTVAGAARALWTIAGPDGGPDPAAARSRAWPPDALLAAPQVPRFAVPEPGVLTSVLGHGGGHRLRRGDRWPPGRAHHGGRDPAAGVRAPAL